MTDQPQPNRFKADMPSIPGVGPGSRRSPGSAMALRLVAGLVAVLLVLVLGTKLVMRSKRAEPAPAQPTPQIEIPTPAADPNASIPNATAENPGIATVTEMAKPWSSKEFFFRNRLTGENVPALLIRLPTGAPTQSDGYWGLAMTSAYGNCRLEYITDPQKLSTDYKFEARHPMVADPCTRAVFDPLQMADMPGGAWARGAIVKGSAFRPPIGIEIVIRSDQLVATKME